MIERQQPYVRQLHVCINNRNGESKSCGYDGSEEVVEELRKVTKERNLKGKVRVVRSGCLDVCAFGPNMMIWPEGLWYHESDQRRCATDRRQILESRSRRSGEITATHPISALAHFLLKLEIYLKRGFAEVVKPRLCVSYGLNSSPNCWIT